MDATESGVDFALHDSLHTRYSVLEFVANVVTSPRLCT